MALLVAGHLPPRSCPIFTNVNSVPSLTSLFSDPLAFLSLSWVQTFLPSLTVNSLRNDSHLAHHSL